MRSLFKILLIFGFLTPSGWTHNLESALTKAAEEEKLVLLYFSGSDWCGPCVLMNKQVYQADAFLEFAEENLVLVQTDFPRRKKNMLSESQAKYNDKLAEKLNPNGYFPYTILLSPDGEVLHEWIGYGKRIRPDEFVETIKGSR